MDIRPLNRDIWNKYWAQNDKHAGACREMGADVCSWFYKVWKIKLLAEGCRRVHEIKKKSTVNIKVEHKWTNDHHTILKNFALYLSHQWSMNTLKSTFNSSFIQNSPKSETVEAAARGEWINKLWYTHTVKFKSMKCWYLQWISNMMLSARTLHDSAYSAVLEGESY